MRSSLRLQSVFHLVLLSAALSVTAWSQAETVPASHPVYQFLKRMEVKRLLEGYHDAVLPLSRKEVGGHLGAVASHRPELSAAEQGWLDDFLSEFQFDITGSLEGFDALLTPSGEKTSSVGSGFLGDRERVLYLYADSTVSLFLNGLLDADARRISGDPLGNAQATYVQVGFRMRGTALDHLGYSLQFTNAQFWGSRDLLARDPIISQSNALTVGDIQNFDFAEGSVRYDAGIVSAQVGRERVLWGAGYDEKMVLSDNIRQFDFIRFDAAYKAVRYSFLHGWLLGTSVVAPVFASGGSQRNVHRTGHQRQVFCGPQNRGLFPGPFRYRGTGNGGVQQPVRGPRVPHAALAVRIGSAVTR